MMQRTDHCHISVMVTAAPGTARAKAAQRFVTAALNAGHRVDPVFFFHDGVTVLQDEWSAGWWRRHEQLPLTVCVAALERRGLTGTQDSRFEVVGLAQWLETALSADRMVKF